MTETLTTTRDLSEWVAMFSIYSGSEPFMAMASAGEREALTAWLKEHGLNHDSIDRHQNGGCWVCGQTNYVHKVIAARWAEGAGRWDDSRPVQVIEVGHICAEDIGLSGVERAYERTARKDRRKAAGVEFIANNDLQKVVVMIDDNRLSGWALNTATDILNKCRSKGTLTGKQIGLLHRIYDDQVGAEIRRAKMAETRSPAPTGRVMVTGTVVKVKHAIFDDHDYPEDVPPPKITVAAEEGFLCWGSASSSIRTVKSGDKVTFKATLTPKEDDPTFAWFKRPANGEIVEIGQ